MADGVEIRSYRSVFELERRIYKIDNLRLNPGGVPLRGIAYLVLAVLVALLASAVPVLGWAVVRVPWLLRYVVGPVACAVVLTMVRVDGRPFHHAAAALLALRMAPRHLSGLQAAPPPGRRWRPGPIVLIADGSDARFRRLRYRGPGAVLIAYPHERMVWDSPVGRRRGVAVRGVGSRPLVNPTALEIADGASLEVGT